MLGLFKNVLERMIPFNKPSVVGNEYRYIKNAVSRGHLSGGGYYTKKCESIIADLIHCENTFLVNSCTSALEMSAILCDIGPGDEVIMPSYTFVSTANAIVARGGTPVFVDMKYDTLNIDPDDVDNAINEKTKSIIPVHYAGAVADMPRICESARMSGIYVVEDAAQALGSKRFGRPAGSFGDLASFSFHETKNIIAGECGCLVVNNPQMIERAYIIRDKGTNRRAFANGIVDKYTWLDIGSSYVTNEITAGFLTAQLENFDTIADRRKVMWNRYKLAFTDFQSRFTIRIPDECNLGDHNYHIFYLLFKCQELRDQFIEYMKCHNVICPFHYIPLHSSPGGKKYGRIYRNDLPVTNKISGCIARLPLYFSLTETEQDYVIQCVIRFLEDSV